MKQMRFKIKPEQLMFLFLFLITLGIIACAAMSVMPSRWSGSTLIYQADVWRLNITYLHKGTKSEGQNGVLYKYGNEVKTPKMDTLMETSIGTLKYYGKRTAANHPWDVTGWNFADKSLIKNSKDVQLK